MPQPPTANTNSSQQEAFTPRKEFIREQKPPPNSFALLAIAGSGFIRLYSFPLQVIDAFRLIFQQRAILVGFRENVSQSLYEFSLDGKPWANAKSVSTEKLLIDLVAIVYQCGYVYLSTLDYGREHDDRLVMAFSKPEIHHAHSRSGTPLPTSPWPNGSAFQSCEKPRSKRLPFALSFTSGTTMRVIAPPLNLTPAILQAVRNSWPRGVVSEKKVGDNSFEFKLKGYKWFQQDTFPADSLCHILALLSSFDAQSYTLLSSISLTNHSRVKDLWIFMGPPLAEDSSYQDSPASSILDTSHGELKRQVHSPDLLARPQTGGPPNSPSHRKFATEPDMVHLLPSQPVKVAADDRWNMEPRQRNDSRVVAISSPPPSAGLSNALRNPTPRAQASTPVDQRVDKIYDGGVRAILPSTISSNVENMTGVGAGIGRFSPNVFCATSPYGGTDSAGKPSPPDLPVSTHTPPRSRSVTPSRPPYALRPVSTRSKTPPHLASHSPSPPLSPPRSMPESGRATPPLLGAGAFRDSAFSSSSQATYYVPIKGHDEDAERDQEDRERSRPFIDKRASLMGTILPGSWQPSPVEEEPEIDIGMGGAQSPADDSNGEGGPETPIYEVGSRVSSPELNRPDSKLRKSEAAVVGMIVNPVSLPPPPPPPRLGQDKRKDSSSSGTGQGWVLVNVDGMSPPSPVEISAARDTRAVSRSLVPLSPASANWNGLDKGTRSPEAQAVIPIDASKKSMSKSKSTVIGLDGSPPSKKTLLGLGRKNSSVQKLTPPPAKDPTMRATKSRPGFRDKLRLIGTPEASRNDSKRRSID